MKEFNANAKEHKEKKNPNKNAFKSFMRTEIIQVWENLFNEGLKTVKEKGKQYLKTSKSE